MLRFWTYHHNKHLILCSEWNMKCQTLFGPYVIDGEYILACQHECSACMRMYSVNFPPWFGPYEDFITPFPSIELYDFSTWGASRFLWICPICSAIHLNIHHARAAKIVWRLKQQTITIGRDSDAFSIQHTPVIVIRTHSYAIEHGNAWECVSGREKKLSKNKARLAKNFQFAIEFCCEWISFGTKQSDNWWYALPGATLNFLRRSWRRELDFDYNLYRNRNGNI